MIEKKYIEELYKISDNIDDNVRELRHLRYPNVGLTDDEKSKIKECEQQLYGVSDVIFNIYSSNNFDHKTAEKEAYDEVFMSANRNSESFKVFSGMFIDSGNLTREERDEYKKFLRDQPEHKTIDKREDFADKLQKMKEKNIVRCSSSGSTKR